MSEFAPSVNHQPPTFGITNDGNFTPTVARFDAATKRLLVNGTITGTVDVNIVGGSSAGTEYTEGDIDATPSGGAIFFQDSGDDSMHVVSDANPLPVLAAIDTTGLATAANQTTIIGHVDGIETLIGTANTALQIIDNIVSGSGVNVSQINGVAPSMGNGGSGTGVQRVTIANDSTGTVVVTQSAAANLQMTAFGYNGASQSALSVDVSGALRVIGKGTAGTADAGVMTVQGIASMTPVQVSQATGTNLHTVLDSLPPPTPNTSGGYDVANNIDVDETEDAVKTSAGKLYGWYWYNDGAAEVYVKYYNDTVANVSVGSTTPFMTIGVPAGGGTNIEWSTGIPFSAAITVAATTGAATADTGAPAANQVVGFSLYK